MNLMWRVTAPGAGSRLNLRGGWEFEGLHSRTMSRMRGTVNAAPVEPATNTTLSNCLRGLIFAYGPSMITLLPAC